MELVRGIWDWKLSGVSFQRSTYGPSSSPWQDRFLSSAKLIKCFSRVDVWLLPRQFSDHSPIMWQALGGMARLHISRWTDPGSERIVSGMKR